MTTSNMTFYITKPITGNYSMGILGNTTGSPSGWPSNALVISNTGRVLCMQDEGGVPFQLSSISFGSPATQCKSVLIEGFDQFGTKVIDRLATIDNGLNPLTRVYFDNNWMSLNAVTFTGYLVSPEK